MKREPVNVPFNWPYMTGKELYYIAEAHFGGKLAGDGPFTKKCHGWLEAETGARKALLTHSCTAALEMAALLLDLKPGDEVIMPSYTFVSTANAFVLQGACPVFVDVCPDTLNLDPGKIEAALSPRTRAIVPVHYAGVACAMDPILDIASRYRLTVIEDAAQGIMAKYKGKPLGALGNLGAYSFHETKNVISGEGGALLINDPAMKDRAEVLREKGTDRSRFFRGEVDKYTWQDVGSSYLPGELIAAFLWAQIEEARAITDRRLAVWDQYHAAFADAEAKEWLRRPVVPADCEHNAHMYYLLLPTAEARSRVMEGLKARGIGAIFHYIPLHSSPAGRRFGRVSEGLSITDDVASRILRLPLWVGLTWDQMEYVIANVLDLAETSRA
jgi:dTDP-4-amino-4,6-dideoxygalactose transaminase